MKKKSDRSRSGKIDLSTLPRPPSFSPPVPRSAGPKPEDVPGLFVFKWCDVRIGWFAECDESLRAFYEKFANRDLSVINLAQALALVGSHKLHELRTLQQWAHKRESTDKSALSVEPEDNWHRWFMIHHCIELACASHEAFGNDLTSILRTCFQLGHISASEEIRSRMEQIFAHTLMYALPGSHFPRGRGRPMEMVVVEADGLKRKIPLPLRAIQVALELATNLRRPPTKKQLEEKLKELHPETKESQRINVSAINWSSIFNQAGLKSLPNSRSGKATQPIRA